MTELPLRTVPLFAPLSEEGLAEVAAALQTRSLAANEVLFNQGDPGKELIIVQSGKLAIYKPEPGAPARGQPIRTFTTGSMLGEMALIDQKPRSLSARAEEATTILALSSDAFRDLLGSNVEISMTLLAGLSDRIRYTTDFLNEVQDWVGRITDGNYTSGMAVESQSQYPDPTLATLAANFAKMAARVKEREDQLKQEVAQLRIEIDEARRKEEASQIMDSDYYRSLKDKVRNMRQKKE
jgi:CRP/FNR family transcriptional regulator